ncbi:ABC transporter permease [Streptomyces sp. NPDC006551]|uniref:ABC transporter permease n=1 Tax=Streptomyces sp. NPDC006551 TaxID=3157178 RepID=UPI0033BEE387
MPDVWRLSWAGFTERRITGFRRGQILLTAALEAAVIAVIGFVLGSVAAAGTLVAMAGTAISITGSPTVGGPWSLAAWLGAVCLAVTALTGVSAAWMATRRSPVSLLAARE